jgi:uncharacterized lipoprotein YbaY
MPHLPFPLFLLILFGLAACSPAPPPEPGTTVGDAANETVPFRARVTLETPDALPEDALLAAYVVEGNFEDGSRRLVAETQLPVSGDSPVLVEIQVPRAELSPELGYDMYAAVVDPAGRLLMSAAANRAPVPATGLHFENVFNVRLLPVATPAPPEQTFRLPGELEFDCGDLSIAVRQEDDGSVTVDAGEVEWSLRPAVATAGGRFSDGHSELWITAELQAFLMLPGEPPRNCAPR